MRSCASCITPDLCVQDESCAYGMKDMRRVERPSVPDEITIGPLTFIHSGHEMYVARGEEMVGTCEHVWEDTWREFVREAKPYHGPG